MRGPIDVNLKTAIKPSQHQEILEITKNVTINSSNIISIILVDHLNVQQANARRLTIGNTN